MYLSYQDFEKATNKAEFASKLIQYHYSSLDVRVALDADAYNEQDNITIKRFQRVYYNLIGEKKADHTVTNNKLASNFFHKLNTQRCNYLLGNGIKLIDDDNKKKLGRTFDRIFKRAAYYSLIHGTSFIYWNVDRIHMFKLTEFAPLWDEYTGALRAGIRFWQIDTEKPMIAVLYEEDGYTKMQAEKFGAVFKITEEKKPYRILKKSIKAGMAPEVVGEENYGSLPIIPMFGNEIRKSTLPGMRPKIDAFDIVNSGFANDMEDVAQIYWLVQNADSMSDEDLRKFYDKLKLNHIALGGSESTVQPYTQEVPADSRLKFLNEIRNQIYEDFGALDVHAVAAGATNDHIDAAYQPMDDETDEFEYCVDECLAHLFELIGMDEEAMFKRNRISNEKERTDMINSSAHYLDDETYLSKLPFIEPDEIQVIMDRKASEDVNRFYEEEPEKEEPEEDTEE